MANQDFGAPSDPISDVTSTFGDVGSRVQDKASEFGQHGCLG